MADTYPGYNSWPEIPGLAFVMADGAFLCCECANRKKGSCANTDAELQEATKLRDQWRIIGAQMTTEEVDCSHCYARIQPTKLLEHPIASIRQWMMSAVASMPKVKGLANWMWRITIDDYTETWRIHALNRETKMINESSAFSVQQTAIVTEQCVNQAVAEIHRRIRAQS